jgi:hypothetical protein
MQHILKFVDALWPSQESGAEVKESENCEEVL